ncbi:MAG: DNA polymerase Y family protein [Nocardioides sp.]
MVWCPDWPIVAALSEDGAQEDLPHHPARHQARNLPHDLPSRQPTVVLANNVVVAGNDPARAEGIRRGMRRRDAQSRCPEVAVFDANPARDARAFEPVLAAVEELRPGVAPLRPGLLAVRAPGRFYGDETAAAAVIAECLVGLGISDCRFGVADDLFTAEQAARRALRQDSVVVPSGGSAEFLRELPVGVLEDPELVDLLRRLGLRTLGEIAALPAQAVQDRFGNHGARIHRLTRGSGEALLATRPPPPDLTCAITFEPPLDSAETICLSVRRTAERFVAQLIDRGLVCTTVRIEAECDEQVATSRAWLHSRWFGSLDLVDRVRWQLGGHLRDQFQNAGITAPVGLVRFLPEVVEPAGAHAEGLWGSATDERVERGIARVQGMLGYAAVFAPVRQGGRTPAARQRLVPWGEQALGLRPAEQPWPGSIPAPAPTRVFREPWPAIVVDARGRSVQVNERGMLSGAPAWFRPAVAGSQLDPRFAGGSHASPASTTGSQLDPRFAGGSHASPASTTGSQLDPRFAGGSHASPGLNEQWQPVAAWAGPWVVDETWWEPGSQRVARFQIVGQDGCAWLMRCGPGVAGHTSENSAGQAAGGAVGCTDWWTEASYD